MAGVKKNACGCSTDSIDVAMVFCDDKVGKPFFLSMMALNDTTCSIMKIRMLFFRRI